MRNTVAIMQRELLSLFYSPIGYIVIAGFLLLTGVIVLVTDTIGPGQPATLRRVFDFTPYVLTIIIPAICMRTISEEYRSGTIESLMTAPLSDAQMVIGKYLAAVIFYAIMLGSTLIYLVIMMIFGNPDIGASLSSYLGLLLLGLAFAGYGVFSSSLTSNQIVAWMIGMIPLMVFVWFSSFVVSHVEGVLRDLFQRVNVNRHLDQFNRGLILFESVVFFLATAAVFLFATVKVVESKRWR
jgi:ABC-2 type transport system permease protein